MKKKLLEFVNGFFSLLFPETCKKCGNELLGKEDIICRKCISDLPRTNFEKDRQNPVAQLFWGKIPINYAFSIFYFRKGETVQKLIHLLKYKKNRKAGAILGKIAGNIIKEMTFVPEIDFIVPVPLHPKKLRIRGYNQCEVLAKSISKSTGIAVNSDVLIRSIYNVSQTKKGKYERWQNVEGIFNVTNSKLFEGKHIMVIDDIITTGSTLEACCYSLSKIPNIRISVIGMAYSAI